MDWTPDKPDFPVAVDSTMLSAFGACPQKFFYEFILKRVPIGRSIHLHAGGCFASAMETIRIAHYRDGLSYGQCLLKAYEGFVKQWGDMETPEKEYKDFINVWCAIEAYFKEYPLDTDYFQPYIKEDGAPAVEFKFAIPTHVLHPVTGDPIMFAGRADMLAQNEPNTCYTVDEKTTKALGASWYYQWDMRGQFYGYSLAARQMGFPCAGALVRGIAIQQTQFAFAEKVLFYTDEQLLRWWFHANKKLLRMVEMYKASIQRWDDLREVHDTWDMSFGDACQSYGGCQYTDLCRRDDPWSIYKDFDRRVWNPLEVDPSKGSEDKFSKMEAVSMADAMAGME